MLKIDKIHHDYPLGRHRILVGTTGLLVVDLDYNGGVGQVGVVVVT